MTSWPGQPKAPPPPAPLAADAVDHPRHYNSHPSGVECITVVEHMGFNLGNAIEDIRKAAWYLKREIERREKAAAK